MSHPSAQRRDPKGLPSKVQAMAENKYSYTVRRICSSASHCSDIECHLLTKAVRGLRVNVDMVRLRRKASKF